jgi:hypothetical protein
MSAAPTRDELEAAHCWWESADRVPGRPAMTAFRQRARLHHARWRAAHGHPIGTHPFNVGPGKQARLVGSRLPLAYARDTGATFVSDGARRAATERYARKEPHQSLDASRTWADLLWPSALAYNLFGDLVDDHTRANRVVESLWPDPPGRVKAIRFEHSPGWLDLAYLGSLSSFDVLFELEGGGVLGVQTRYADIVKREIPKPIRLQHYLAIHERSQAFRADAVDAVNATDLTVMWLDHLLVHSMLQHHDGEWDRGRLVVVHPAANPDFVGACDRYRSLLVDGDETYASTTLEPLLRTPALRERYALV